MAELIQAMNGSLKVISGPNEREKRRLFALYAGKIQPPPDPKELEAQRKLRLEELRRQAGPPSLTPLSEATKRALFAKYAATLPPPGRDAQDLLYTKVKEFHAKVPGEWNGFASPNLWTEQQALISS